MDEENINSRIDKLIQLAKEQANELFDPNSEKMMQGYQIGINDDAFIERAKRLQIGEQGKLEQSIKGYKSRMREYSEEIHSKPGKERLSILLYNVHTQIAFLLRARHTTHYFNTKFDLPGFLDPQVFISYKKREYDELIDSFKGMVGQIEVALTLVKESVQVPEHNQFNTMPMEDVRAFFRAGLCVKNSEGVQILNDEDFEKFINAAFLGKTLNKKLTFNIGTKGKGKIGKVFHEFYTKNKDFESTHHCTPKYKKLATDHFSNWTQEQFSPFFRS